MQTLTFTQKLCSTTLSLDTSFQFPLNKPMLCPYCDAYQDATRISGTSFSIDGQVRYGVAKYKCTHCQKEYLAVYEIDKQERKADFLTFFPSVTPIYANSKLDAVSPRFIEIYNQALRAENIGDLDLAGMGYRLALEILVKDFAIKELDMSHDEVVRKSLHGAIGDYLGESDLVSTADVVRILGNDYAHYEAKYPEYDLDLLKQYLAVFIAQIEAKLLILHPPVARKS